MLKRPSQITELDTELTRAASVARRMLTVGTLLLEQSQNSNSVEGLENLAVWKFEHFINFLALRDNMKNNKSFLVTRAIGLDNTIMIYRD